MCAKIKTAKVTSKKQNLKKICDQIWSECVKTKAGHKSELSGKTEKLQAHHICGKGSVYLRYEIDNGICLTAGEHKFIAHRQDRYESFRQSVQVMVRIVIVMMVKMMVQVMVRIV